MRGRARLRLTCLSFLSGSVLLAGVSGAATSVSTDGGRIVLIENGKRTVLIDGGGHGDAVLSPDGRFVVFTQGALTDDATSCAAAVTAKQALKRVDVRSGQVTLLVAARAGRTGEAQLCNFRDKQFSSDGKRLYFTTPGWATSGALWVLDTGRKAARYLQPSNGFVVLSRCTDAQYRDKLAVSQHRYFAFGGSFDWYWLFDASGRKQIAPIGESLDQAYDACGIEAASPAPTPSNEAGPAPGHP